MKFQKISYRKVSSTQLTPAETVRQDFKEKYFILSQPMEEKELSNYSKGSQNTKTLILLDWKTLKIYRIIHCPEKK